MNTSMDGQFNVYIDNNPLTYILITARLDATGQRWVVSLASYNFQLHYKSGKQNVEADALSLICWDDDEVTRKSLLIDMECMGNTSFLESYAGSLNPFFVRGQ